jgi:microcystin-dependent protein
MPAVNDQVIACIDGQDRWIESVVRPTTSTPYIQISSGSLVGAGAPTGAILGYPFATPPSGWLVCDGTPKNYNDYPALGALYGAVPGGTFTLPNMLDRFMAGLSAAGSLTNTTGTLSPGSAIASHTHSTSHTHTFTGDSHSHNIAHDHADTFAANAATEATHTHSVNPGSTTSSVPSAASSRYFYTSGTLVSVPSGGHSHNVDIASFTSGAGSTHDHGITVSGGVTALGATNVTATATGTNSTDTTATGASSWSTAASTPKATLLNFIIKT